MPSEMSDRLKQLLDSLSDLEHLSADVPAADLFAERAIVECKGVEGLSPKEINAMVAKNVSGFANAEGGVLVLGVDSRRTGNDEPEDLSWKLVQDAAAMADRVRGSLHSLIEPSVPGIDIRHVAKDDGSGVVLVAVPRFDGHPVQARPEKDHGFWIRMGSSTTRMLYRQVAERFVAAPVPHAVLAWRWKSNETRVERQMAGIRHPHGTAIAQLVLKNDSAASLKHLFARISISGVELVEGAERQWPVVDWRYLSPRLSTPARDRGFRVNESPGEPLESTHRARTVRPEQGQSPLIYPGEELVLFECRVTTLPDGGGVYSLQVEAHLNADGMMQVDETLALDYNELRAKIHETFS